MLMLEEDGMVVGKVEFGLVALEHIPLIWQRVLEILRVEGKEWLETVSEMEVLAQLANGHWELWLAGDEGVLEGYVICMWEIHARKTRYHVLAIAGEGLDKYWKKGLEKLEHYACLKGAHEIVMEGRPGWKRLLLREGYMEKTVRMIKPVKVLWRN